MIKQKQNIHSRQFPPGINVPQRAERIFFISYFFSYYYSAFLSCSETIEKWLLLSFTFIMAEVQPINVESKSQSKNTAKDSHGWLKGGDGKKAGQNMAGLKTASDL